MQPGDTLSIHHYITNPRKLLSLMVESRCSYENSLSIKFAVNKCLQSKTGSHVSYTITKTEPIANVPHM